MSGQAAQQPLGQYQPGQQMQRPGPNAGPYAGLPPQAAAQLSPQAQAYQSQFGPNGRPPNSPNPYNYSVAPGQQLPPKMRNPFPDPRLPVDPGRP